VHDVHAFTDASFGQSKRVFEESAFPEMHFNEAVAPVTWDLPNDNSIKLFSLANSGKKFSLYNPSLCH
jgi:hypothetical protein